MTTTKVEQLTDDNFARLLAIMPARAQMLVRSGMCDWRTVCTQWLNYYAEHADEFTGETRTMLVEHHNNKITT